MNQHFSLSRSKTIMLLEVELRSSCGLKVVKDLLRYYPQGWSCILLRLRGGCVGREWRAEIVVVWMVSVREEKAPQSSKKQKSIP
jgi:hypothetical protein